MDDDPHPWGYGGAVVVEKYPRANGGAVNMWQGATYGNGAYATRAHHEAAAQALQQFLCAVGVGVGKHLPAAVIFAGVANHL